MATKGGEEVGNNVQCHTMLLVMSVDERVVDWR